MLRKLKQMNCTYSGLLRGWICFERELRELRELHKFV